MDNNENKKPEISFGGEKAGMPIDDNAPSPVMTADSNDAISEHQRSLDMALKDFENELGDLENESSAEAMPLISDTNKRRPARKDKPAQKDIKKNFGAYESKAKAKASSKSGKASKKKSSSKNVRKKRKKRERILNSSIITGLTLTVVIVTISIVLSTGAITLGMEYLGINKSNKEITFNIPEGSNNDEIADILVENNIIKYKPLFKLALRVKNQPTLFPGDITLSPSTSYPAIIDNLSYMREVRETVTLRFKEGTNLLAVANKLEKNGVCSKDEFLFTFNGKQEEFGIDNLVTRNVEAFYSMEGFFFPDTYEFYLGDSAYNVTKIIRENFESKFTDEMYARMRELDMDLSEVVTLASIVQSEAGTVEDMPIVASVFHNRLNDPDTFPNLQSDATANYITKVVSKVETSSAMLERYTNVYDTYICFGLPAGPVCDPGLDAIKAVLYPEDTNYYYFCNNLETGESFFAETLEEHEKNLKKAGLAK